MRLNSVLICRQVLNLSIWASEIELESRELAARATAQAASNRRLSR